ncbi:hypothetical protein Y1Q_0007290 [Alligator mississippiensis]|uniref:DDE Tnp4 domain-containing protein n=1 Tax=Alligator mississippiensis TaxID=8496 RepID=A0A151NN91_ALLMI|nr:hypothetical protein Y1Q_0007290 [Alligator mississippiensis]
MKLATPGIYCYIANQFSIGKSVAGEAIWEACGVIQDILANHFIHLINPQNVITDFSCMGFPTCVSAVDGIYIPTLCPTQASQAFNNCRGFSSIILQGIADRQGQFTCIFTS